MTIYYSYIIILLLLGGVNVGTTGFTFYLKVLASLTIILIIGFRYEVGVDWLLYRDFYYGNAITLTLEPGYRLISALFSSTGMSYWVFVSCITLFSIIVLNRFFKKLSVYPVFALVAYYSLSFTFNMEVVRQGLAVSFFYIGIMYLLKEKLRLYYVCILMASMCHISAVLFFVLPVIFKSKVIQFQKILIIPGLVLAIVGFYPVETIIETLSLLMHNSYSVKLLSYTTPANISNVITFSLIFKLLIYTLFYIRKKYLLNVIPTTCNINFIEKSTVFMIFIDVYIGRFGTISSRLDEYFLPGFVCMATLVIYSFTRYLNRIVFTLFITTYLLVSFYRLSQDDYFKLQFLPYQNYLLISNDSSNRFDKSRENAVDYHWKVRDK